MKQKSLEKAIRDFNDWNGATKIYYKPSQKRFFTEVFINDVDAVQTYGVDGVYEIYSKFDRDSLSIGNKRKQLLEYISNELDNGEELDAILYNCPSDLAVVI